MPPGFIGANQLQDNSVGPNKQSTLARKYSFCTFQAQGRYGAGNGYGAPTGTAGDVNIGLLPCDIGGVLPIEWHVKGTQTILAPTFTLTGLDVSGDQTNNDGGEFIFGGHTIRGKHAYTIGGPGFFARLKWKASDVSGQDDCAFGFRRVEAAFQAGIDTYTDFAVLNNISGDIKIETALNDATTVTVDTTQDWADAATHSFEIQVAQDRTTRFLIDGAFPTVTKTFLWDVSDVVVPVFFFMQDATSPGTLEWVEFEAGYLPKRRTS